MIYGQTICQSGRYEIPCESLAIGNTKNNDFELCMLKSVPYNCTFQLMNENAMRNSFGILLISLFTLLSGYALADTNFSNQKSASGFEPHFFATLGSVSRKKYTERVSASIVDDALQTGLPSSVTFSPGRESTLVGGIGMRPTERWSFEFRLNGLPQTDYVVGAPFSDRTPEIVNEGHTHGWNAELAAEYTFPLASWGLKVATRAGFSQSKVKVFETRKSTNPNSTLEPIETRTSETWRDPFLGVGLRLPFPGKYDNWEASLMFTRIFTNEDSLNQSLNVQLIHNFK